MSTEHAAPPAVGDATQTGRRVAIPRTTLTSGAPLSFAQQRLWFVDQLAPNAATYNVPVVIDLEGPLDVDALHRALSEIVRRHESLRTTFPSRNGVPQQVILPPDALPFPIRDLSCLDAAERDREVDALVSEELHRPFDLATGPIFRIGLLRLSTHRHLLLGGVHHIVFDGWSSGIFFRELTALYEAFTAGHASPLADLSHRVIDFAMWQRQQLEGESSRREMQHWTSRLQDPPRLAWPTDFARPAALTDQAGRERVLLPRELIFEVAALSRREGVTLFVSLLSAFAVLLHRFCRQDDLVIGTPIANRTRQEFEPLIGFLLNMMALRIEVDGEPTFRSFLKRVKGEAFTAYAHQQLPFEQVVEQLRPARSLNQGTLLEAVFVLDNNPGSIGAATVRVGELTLKRRTLTSAMAKFDLVLHMFSDDGGLRATIDYRTDLFESATGATLLRGYRSLLEGIVANPDAPVGRLPLQPVGESHALIPDACRHVVPYPRDCTISGLFEREAARSPEAIALVADESQLTYQALNREANRLARHLREAGVAEGARVGVYLARSAEAIVALLAIAKCGAAYVPLDPSQPIQRTEALIRSSRVGTVVSRAGWTESVLAFGIKVVSLDADREIISRQSDDNLASSASAESLAYVLFTSGSTGEPKPVGVPHRAIARLAYGLPDIPVGHGARVLQAAPLMFDASTFEIWNPLLRGGCVVVSPNDLYTPRELERVIADHQVTVVWLTASLFNLIVDERVEALQGVRYVITGGEALSVAHVTRALAALPSTTIVNGYGPTEATTFSTYHVIERSDLRRPSIPIGRPVGNTSVYVLDRNQQPVPPGFPGELWIGGDALAAGYIGDDALTADRFRPDPFSPPPARMYRTGDEGRLLSDGVIEFLGRTDAQIKIRGFRIEPAEVEAALAGHPQVGRVVVVAREHPATGRVLVAYVVPSDAASPPSHHNLREHLRGRLPEYMIPRHYEVVSDLPLLATGKADRRALRPPDFDRGSIATAPDLTPLSVTEAAIAAVWRERLGVAELYRSSHFFELGGDSLLAVQIVSQLGTAFGVALAVRSIFECPTIAGLAAVVEQHLNAGSSPGPAHEPPQPPIEIEHSATHIAPPVTGQSFDSLSEADVERRILAMWQRLLGQKIIDVDRDFFELGGHSLLAVRLASEVESHFGIRLPIATLFEHGTVRRQAQWVVEHLTNSDQQETWSPLVGIQREGTRPPLFLVHGIGGEVLSYAALAAHLGQDQPLYGLQANTQEGARACASVEAMASAYVAAIRQRQPSGPYHLGAFSAGGLIVYEMAQQLLAAGENVALLVMIDCWAPSVDGRQRITRGSILDLIKHPAHWFADDDLLRSGLSDAGRRLMSRTLRARDRLLQRLGREEHQVRDIRHQLGLWAFSEGSREYLEAFRSALHRYKPQHYDGAIAVIRARTRGLGQWQPPAPDLGWSALVRGGVGTHLVNGAHDTILREPRLRALGRVLRDLLDATH